MLEVASLCAAYGDLPALNDISFKLEKGEALVLLGRNGVGKTTLLKSLIGILKPSAGHIYLNGDDVTGWKPHRRTRAGIGYVPQGRGIFSNLTVEENLLTGLRGRSDGRTSIPDDVLELFPILRERLKQPAGTFSGGQQQQLALARALCGNPQVLLLDEPSEGIQPSIVQQIGALLQQFSGGMGITILLVEQNLELARKTASRCLVMEKGRIAGTLTKAQLNDDQKVFAALAL